MRIVKGTLYALGALFLLGIIGSKINPKRDGSPDALDAKVMCEHFVSDRLKAPSSADFSWPRDTQIAGKDGLWTVSGYVDAQNAFGAKLRNKYFCQVRYTAERKWHLEYLRMH